MISLPTLDNYPSDGGADDIGPTPYADKPHAPSERNGR